MTNPGDVERIATKVVPYVVVGVVDDEIDEPIEPNEGNFAESEPARVRHRPTWLGWIAAALGVATLVLFIVAMVVANGGDYPAGTALAHATIVVSFSAIITAIVCLVLGYRRRWAAFGLAVAILSNPLVLVNVFRAFGG